MTDQKSNRELASLIKMHREIAIRMQEIKDRAINQKEPPAEWAECVSAELQIRLQLLRWAPIGSTFTDKALAYLMAISQLAELDQDEQTLAFVLSAAIRSDKVIRGTLES
ncbi:hypothetical protein [Rhizobium tumorigenes]|uniref:Uncharacterized protein n=1 Tax=Rhizobium tumorigenes TaxID=2041385 RepID=A0AAF1KTY8_9HYPH|nr:hypothetical protein [Rhizobium tumorigenes]WFR97810.1 hypothetical protein PR017_18025 [Rhizobium tumorigenes]WFS03371.1 hypothetical protein PR016_18900 [Rhizobium tumorigenes]